MTELRDNQVTVKFAANIPGDAQASSMMALEKHLRQLTGQDIEVFKEAKGDDSRLRASMTAEQRAKL